MIQAKIRKAVPNAGSRAHEHVRITILIHPNIYSLYIYLFTVFFLLIMFFRYRKTVAAQRFYRTEELLLIHVDAMATPFTWYIGPHISKKIRRIAQGIIHTRIRCIVLNFIEENILLEFFSLMDKTDSIILGSCALAALTVHRNWQPGDLNLSVPRSAINTWKKFMRTHGYKEHIVGQSFPSHPLYRVRQSSVSSSVIVYGQEETKVNKSNVSYYARSSTIIINRMKSSLLAVARNRRSCRIRQSSYQPIGCRFKLSCVMPLPVLNGEMGKHSSVTKGHRRDGMYDT